MITEDQRMSEADKVLKRLLEMEGEFTWKRNSNGELYMFKNPSLRRSDGYKARVYSEVRKVMNDDGRMNTKKKSVNLCVTDPDGRVVLSSEWPCPGPGTAEDVHGTWMSWTPDWELK